MQKTYQFNKILSEYNKLHGGSFKLPISASNIIILHTTESMIFYVTYSDKDGAKNNKKSLKEFIYYHISDYIREKDIIDIILSKEKEKLDLKIEIRPPNKIRHAYLFSNYAIRDVGVLGKSCMRYKENQRALNFYIKNDVRIVVLVDNKNKIHARALLWDGIYSMKLKKPFTYLDRVYTRSDTLAPPFYELAAEHEWKSYAKNRPIDILYKPDLDITNLCHFPYTDTFRRLYYKDNLVASESMSSNKIKNSSANISLTHTGDGGYFANLDPNRVREAITGNYISKKDATRVKRYDGYVLKKNIANINGVYYSIHDGLVVKTTLDGYVLKENSVNEVFSNELIDKAKAVHSPKHNGYIHKKNVVCIKDEIYHNKDTDIVCFDSKWYHISECFINYDREEVNKEISKPVLTPNGNKEFVKQTTLFDNSLTEKYMSYLMFIQLFTHQGGPCITRKGSLIPKEKAVIAYNLIYSPVLDKLLYQEVYFTKNIKVIKLVTGEYIISTDNNRGYLKKFNNKWYIKQDFKAPDKNQLQFAFMQKEK
jgi:hypothetical protein